MSQPCDTRREMLPISFGNIFNVRYKADHVAEYTFLGLIILKQV